MSRGVCLKHITAPSGCFRTFTGERWVVGGEVPLFSSGAV